MRPEHAIVPIVRSSPDLPISELLGSGFFIGDGERLLVVTAAHVIKDNPLLEGERYTVVFAGTAGVSAVSISAVLASPDVDLAVCVVEASLLPEAIRLPIASTNPALNEDVVCFEYSSTRIERQPGRTHVSFEPYAHKGNVVRAYDSTFPEGTPTPTLLTSFPALQGASGAPVLVKTTPRRTLAVVGMMVANAERHLMPAQVLKLEDGGSVTEEVRYYLPYGKALACRAVGDALQAMGIPFELADIKPTDGASEGGAPSVVTP